MLSSHNNLKTRASWVLAFFLVSLLNLSEASQYTAQWIDGRGDWMDPTKWSGGIVPRNTAEAHFSVIIDSSPADEAIITLNGPLEISNLKLGNFLNVDSPSQQPVDFIIRDDFHWSGGYLSGWQAQYHVFGNALFDGNTYKTMERQCSLHIHNTGKWTAGHLDVQGYGRFVIYPGAVFSMETGGYFGSAVNTSSADVQIDGTLRMNAPGKTVRIFGEVIHNGVLDVAEGDLILTRGYQGGGLIQTSPTASLTFSPVFDQAPNFDNKGKIFFTRLQANTNITLAGKTILLNGMQGIGNVSLPDAQWAGGYFEEGGTVTIPTGGKLEVQGHRVRTFRNLINNGLLTFTKGANFSGYPFIVPMNNVNGLIEMRSDSWIGDTDIETGGFLNLGRMTKADDSGKFSINSDLENKGLIEAQKGVVTLARNTTNSGTLRVAQGALMQIGRFQLTEQSIIEGNGTLSLGQGELAGAISSNLNLNLGNVTVENAALNFNHVSLNIALSSGSGGSLIVQSNLTFKGDISGASVVSRGLAEIVLNHSSRFYQNSSLVLAGRSRWYEGKLELMEAGAMLANAGELRLAGAMELDLKQGAIFTNSGLVLAERQVGELNLQKSAFSMSILTLPNTNILSPAEPFGFSGYVEFSSDKISALDGAKIRLSQFGFTNGIVELLDSHLEAHTSFSTAGTRFTMDAATIKLPPSGWQGTAHLTGNAHIQGDVVLKELNFTPTLGKNPRTSITGNYLALPDTVTRITMEKVGNELLVPGVDVIGKVRLDGKLELSAAFNDFSLQNKEPIVIFNSSTPIIGSFSNATNGQVIQISARYQGRIFYGSTSPYGDKSVVIEAFGTYFDSWRFDRFTAPELADQNVSGEVADPDGNGFNNLAEFLLGISSGPQARTPFVEYYPQEKFSLIKVKLRKTNLSYNVSLAISQNLSEWTEVSLGRSSPTLILHRIFETDEFLEYVYLYQANPSELFVRTKIAAASSLQ